MANFRRHAAKLLPGWTRGTGASNLCWVTPALAVGGAAMVRDPWRLRTLGVRAVLDVQAEADDRGEALAKASLAYLKLPVEDFAAPRHDQLDHATDWILERLGADEPVLIHCREGRGRSVTFAIATLLRMGYDLPQSYNLMRKARAEISPTESQLRALQRYAEALENAEAGRSADT